MQIALRTACDIIYWEADKYIEDNGLRISSNITLEGVNSNQRSKGI